MKFSEILDMADSEAFIHPDGKKIPAVVHTAIYKKSSKGNDMLAVTYRVTGGPNAGKGRPIRHYILFNDSGRQQISNLGFPAKEFTALGALDAEDAFIKIAAVIAGKPCALDLGNEEFNGRPQNKVTWVHPPGAAANGPSVPRPEAKKPEPKTEQVEDDEPDEELAELQAELEAKLAAKKAKRSTPPSDLPF